MKKIYFAMIVLGLSAGISLSASAEENSLKDRLCEVESGLAYDLMNFRQNGAPIHKLLKLSEEPQLKEVVREAYKAEQFHTEYEKEAIKVEFAKLQYYICLDRLGVDY